LTKRTLVSFLPEQSDILLNWFEELKRRVPAEKK
jgi:hypothetical protein